MINNKRIYRKNGIIVDPGKIHPDHQVKIAYDGLLSKSGAAQVYAHVAFDEDWNSQQVYPMIKKADGFEVCIAVEDADNLNVAFKDCANNWDNNDGHNYTFDITE